MLNFLLDLPVWSGLIAIISIISLAGLLIVTQIKKLLAKRITKQHEKIGRLLFRVTAGLIALLISLSYANERVAQSKVIDSMELEASLIVNVFIGLKSMESSEAEKIFSVLSDYVNLTIDDQWNDLDNNPYFSKAKQSLIEANVLMFKLPVKNENEAYQKKIMIDDMNHINKLMQVRIYSHHSLVPHLIFILLVALVFMWTFFTVYKLDFVSLLFLSLYNILIAILLYFVFMLSNPLIGPMKIDAHSFTVIKTKGLDIENKY